MVLRTQRSKDGRGVVEHLRPPPEGVGSRRDDRRHCQGPRPYSSTGRRARMRRASAPRHTCHDRLLRLGIDGHRVDLLAPRQVHLDHRQAQPADAGQGFHRLGGPAVGAIDLASGVVRLPGGLVPGLDGGEFEPADEVPSDRRPLRREPLDRRRVLTFHVDADPVDALPGSPPGRGGAPPARAPSGATRPTIRSGGPSPSRGRGRRAGRGSSGAGFVPLFRSYGDSVRLRPGGRGLDDLPRVDRWMWPDGWPHRGHAACETVEAMMKASRSGATSTERMASPSRSGPFMT